MQRVRPNVRRCDCAGRTHRTALVAVLFLLTATRLFAHDIPRDVTVQAFAKPEGHGFALLVRVPLKAIMDIEFPRKERDYVDLDRVDQSLRDAAMIWLARKIELYEENTLLPDPRILSTRMSLESDRSFGSYEEALAHVNGPALTNDTSIFWEQGIMDVLFEYPIQSDQSHFAIHMAFDRLGILEYQRYVADKYGRLQARLRSRATRLPEAA